MRSAKESNWDLPKRFKITTLNLKLSPIVWSIFDKETGEILEREPNLKEVSLPNQLSRFFKEIERDLLNAISWEIGLKFNLETTV
jgi:hypothetical protein